MPMLRRFRRFSMVKINSTQPSGNGWNAHRPGYEPKSRLISQDRVSPPFQRGLKGMPRGSVEGTPKPIDNRLINFGVKHGKSPSRPCECEQGILSRERTRSRPERDLTEDSM